VYWRLANGTRGPLVGSIAGSGFREPRCTGISCDLIERSMAADGAYAFQRRAYGDKERATIEASGPGYVEVTAFGTEDHYDTLSVGAVTLSGNLSGVVPRTVEFDKDGVSIDWSSDESVTANGWSFRLHQDGARAELDLQATKILGPGFEVVSAHGATELLSSVTFVEIADSTTEAAPTSPPDNQRDDERQMTTPEPSQDVAQASVVPASAMEEGFGGGRRLRGAMPPQFV